MSRPVRSHKHGSGGDGLEAAASDADRHYYWNGLGCQAARIPGADQGLSLRAATGGSPAGEMEGYWRRREGCWALADIVTPG